MNNKGMAVDIIYTLIVTLIFSVSVSGLIPCNDKTDEAIRFFVIGWLSIMAFFIIACFCDYKKTHQESRHPYLETATTILLFPLMLSFCINNKADEYLRLYPEDHKATFIFNIEIEKTRDSGIGNEIHYNTFVNDTRITGKAYENGSENRLNNVATVNVDEPIFIRTEITEYDVKFSDHGEKTYKLEYYAENKGELHSSVNFSQNITVRERGGRKNSGASADFTVKYKVNRIIPDLKTWFFLPFFITDVKDICYLIAMFVVGIWTVYSICIVNVKVPKLENERIKLENKENEKIKEEKVLNVDNSNKRPTKKELVYTKTAYDIVTERIKLENKENERVKERVLNVDNSNKRISKKELVYIKTAYNIVDKSLKEFREYPKN